MCHIHNIANKDSYILHIKRPIYFGAILYIRDNILCHIYNIAHKEATSQCVRE